MENSDQSLTLSAQMPRRRLGTLDFVCLGWNCVIGSGIFLCQGEIAQAIGPYGPMMFLLGGLLSIPVALCFGELARRYSGTGGSSLYAHKVFGPRSGFVVGWVMWLSGLIGGATVAHALARFILQVGGWPQEQEAWVAALIVVILAAINWLGTRGGAWSNNILALSKLGPLLLACLIAPFLVGPGQVIWPSSLAMPDQPQWLLGLLLVLYTFSGFEEIALPAGEGRNPEKQVPRATLIVLISSALAYTVLQGLVSALGVAGAERPLEAAFATSLPWLSQLLMLAAMLSYASVNASIAFTTPRSLWTLAHHGWLPVQLKRLHPQSDAPQSCILVSSTLTIVLVFLQDLTALIALSVLASLLQHLSTSLATWKIRGWASRPGIPHLAVAVCLLLLLTSRPEHIQGIAALLGVGAVLAWLARPQTGR